MKNFIDFLGQYTGKTYDDFVREALQDKEHKLGFARLDLANLEDWVKNIASEWNGDEAGVMEERAQSANRIVDYIGNILEELEFLEESEPDYSSSHDDFDWSDHERDLQNDACEPR